MSTTIVVPTDSFVYIATDGGVMTTSTNPDGGSLVHVTLLIDNVAVSNGAYAALTVTNSAAIPAHASDRWSFSTLTFLQAGTHTVSVVAARLSGSDAWVSGDNTTAEQGSLSVLVLKQ